ncbi:hypothetical protein LZ016_10375 [Sphingomonas sp. SM33]|uniref:Uncharacterized protein n=1 Tax=Sphingomonas telluris TaxID=2907998 RepID=A0ABS9VPR8_9SPHN|nr:hypothetical protein [Sphingomonas telluris]MCH8616504.1 hypothetical protein [Sphingomonas telluris]
MFLDLKSGDHWGDPVCKSCKLVIAPAEPTEVLKFDGHNDQQLDEMTGLYHAHCAKPYLSILRALNALGRFGL